VRLSIAGEQFPLPGGVDISAYRIVQEGLTNVLKHAGASQAFVLLGYAPGQLSIEIQDNGHGVALGNGNSPGHGLIGIRERVRLYDGEMSTSSRDGFLLQVRLPLTRQPL
jgi:signal transduction histidine kinase